MSFKLKNLDETNFYDLNHAAIGIEDKRIPKKERAIPWKCAVNEADGILFTQLISSTGEMRDDYYYYLMLIDNNPIFILYNSGYAGVLNMGAAKEYELSFIIKYAVEASKIVTANESPILFKNTKKLYDGIYSQL
ncbi:MAG: hypothetical protein AAFZ92_07405 [Pseudomonadota bacterium]